MSRADLLRQQADTLAPRSPAQAARLYLDAAKASLEQAGLDPDRESEHVNEAAALFLKAEALTRRQDSPSEEFLDGLHVRSPRFTFDDVGGLGEVKQAVALCVIAPLRQPDLFSYFNRGIGGGILMYGPPGCGKSFLAEAAAGEAGVPFLHIKASDLKSRWVGETEQRIAELFTHARTRAPCILFFDEFESLGSDRTDLPHYARSFVSQLLTEMDGVGSKDQQILLLAATNEPWSLDGALRREGRFGRTVFVPPPDRAARLHILTHLLDGVPLEGPLDLDALAAASLGLTGADLKGVVTAAKDHAIAACLKHGIRRPLRLADLCLALKGRASTATPWFRKAKRVLRQLGRETEFPEISAYKPA